MNKKIATITIELFQEGLLATCEDTGEQSLCLDGNQLMDFLNFVKECCDPDATFVLTDLGKKYLEDIAKNEETNKS